MTTTTETPADALARIQSTHSKNDGQAILQFYTAGVELDDCQPRVNILTAKAWRALGKRIGKGATAQRVYGWRPAKKTDKKTGEEKDGMTPFTSLLFHESQMVDLKAPAGTAPSAWQNPALVKTGTYDENGKVIGKDAPTETDEHAQELADISHAEYKADEQLQQVYADNAAGIIDVEFKREPLRLTWTPPEPAPPTARRIEAPKTGKARQLAMF